MPGRNRLSRRLGLLDFFSLGMNGVVGAGIFLLPGILFARAGSLSILAFGICGLLCLPLALTFSVLSRFYRGTGGAYLYARENFGPFAGFSVGWMIWIASVMGWASVAKGFILYSGYFLPGAERGLQVPLLSALFLLLAIFNYRGVKAGALANNIIVLLKLFPLLLFCGAGIFFLEPGRLALPPAPLLPGLGKAVFIALYAYLGFEAMPIPAEEGERPERDLPLAILLVLGASALLYILVQGVAVSTYPGLSSSSRPLLDSAGSFLGKTGGVIMGFGAIFSTFGANSSIAITSPRLLFALSRDGLLPGILGRVHPRFSTPYISVIATAILAFTFSISLDFETLAIFTVLASLWHFLPASLALASIKRGGGDLPYFRGFRGWLLLILSFLTLLILIAQADLKALLANLLLFSAGAALYCFRRKAPHQ